MGKTEPGQLAPYLAAGMCLIPLHRHDHVDTDDRKRGKSPIHGNWTKRQYRNDDALAHMAGGMNVGVRLEADDLVVDVDPRNFPVTDAGVRETLRTDNPFRRLCDRVGLDPSAYPTVVTGSGGLHLYMTKPGDASLVDTHQDYPGVEFKSKGRQVVAAGSVHPDTGLTYEWDVLGEPLDGLGAPAAPEALVALAGRPTAAAATGGGEYDQEQLAAMLDRLEPEGFGDQAKWLQLMMACHHATSGDGRQEFIDWSTGDPAYADDAEGIGRRWDSLHAGREGNAITVGTLHKFLADAGAADAIPRTPAADDFDGLAEEDAEAAASVAAAAAEVSRRPIRVGEGRLLQMVADAKAALAEAAPDEVLQRHGHLVRPVRLERNAEEGGVRHRAGATVLMPVNEHWLQKRMAECARWFRRTVEKPREGGGSTVKDLATDPPVKVARLIVNDQGDWPFHSLTGMVTAPTLDVSTGRLVDRPGIDPASGLLAVFDPADFPRLDPDVGQDGARERLDRVHHSLFRGMPFVDEASRAVAMSALVTALVRPTMRTAPMHIFDAAMAGSGKSKMAKTVGVVATGVEPAASAWASSEDENEKRIAALYRKGSPVVLFDNVDAKRGNRLDGNILNIVLTEDPASIRVLGKTEDETLNTRLTVLATGNNVVVAGDVCRRAVKCRLDARCAEPERRSFDFDPVEEARSRRPRIVADLLEALSAYVRAGRPSDPSPLGSFEDWTVVRGLLLWCGMADPADTVADVKATDAARDDVVLALETWHLAFGDDWTTAADVAALVASAADDLDGRLGRELFEGIEAMVKGLLDGRTDRAWVGRALSSTAGQAAGDYYLQVQSGRTSRFRVTCLSDA